MSHAKASEVATAVNRVMHLDPEDQSAMLEVISDYFTDPDPNFNDPDFDDYSEVDEYESVVVHTQGKIAWQINYNKLKGIKNCLN